MELENNVMDTLKYAAESGDYSICIEYLNSIFIELGEYMKNFINGSSEKEILILYVLQILTVIIDIGNDVMDTLIFATESGDYSAFFDNLDSIFIKLGENIKSFADDSSQKKEFISYAMENLTDLIQVCRMSGECINSFTNDSPQNEGFISCALKNLTGLIQMYGMGNEVLSIELAKTMLLIITDEKCSIMNIKKAILLFTLIIKNPSIINAIVNDERLEGSLQILGRKVPSIGDYECQALLFEALYRITCGENREYWAYIWFPDSVARNGFITLDYQAFEMGCRNLLNHINRNEPERRVFSFIASSVAFGSFQLSEPFGCELWIDFNYDSQSISFYCSELSCEEPAENSGLWETVVINSSSVKSYMIRDKPAEKKKEIMLLLTCPCHTLIDSLNKVNPALNSNEVKILFWEISSIHQHLGAVYGKDKNVSESSVTLKVSAPIDDIRIVDDVSDVRPNEVFPQRKVSNLSAPIPADICENEDFIPGTSENQNLSVFRKISQSADAIHFTTEDLSENLRSQSFRKVSASSEVIQVETSKIGECVKQKTKRRSSISVDTIFYDQNTYDADNESWGEEKEASTSSEDINDCEMISKIHLKRVRLYNLDSAPVYDVPPNKSSSSEPASQENLSGKPNSHVANAVHVDISENTVNTCVLKEKQKVKSDDQKIYSSMKRGLKIAEDIEQRTVKDKKIRLIEDLPESYEDFQEQANRDIDRRRGRSSTATAIVSKNSIRKRKSEASHSCDSQTVKNNQPIKRPRRAAVEAMQKTKAIFDSTSVVTCDKIEVMNESDEDSSSAFTPRSKKRNKLSKIRSDTDTQSSEVSWMKQNKPCFLFETPKKNYSEWRKSLHKKKKLPVESVAEHSETQKDSTETSLLKTGTEFDTQLSPPHLNNNSLTGGMKSDKCDETSKYQIGDADSIELNLQHPCKKKADNVEHLSNEIKNKANKFPVFSKKIKRQKTVTSSEAIDESQNSSVNCRSSENINSLLSRLGTNSVIDSTSFRNAESQKSVDRTVSERIVTISKTVNESEKSFKKHKQHKKLKDFSDNSFNSLHSKLTCASLIDDEKGKKWFDAVTSALSQDANNLSRRLLNTVEKCFCEFSIKMSTLRTNLIKTAEVFEMPPSPNTCQHKLKNLVKNCRIIRLEVEESIKKMHDAGKGYFEAEEKWYRKLKRKNKKASKKFISNMRKAEQNATRKLEGKVLLKTKSFMKKLLKDIESV